MRGAAMRELFKVIVHGDPDSIYVKDTWLITVLHDDFQIYTEDEFGDIDMLMDVDEDPELEAREFFSTAGYEIIM